MTDNKIFNQATITKLPNPTIERYALITVRGQKKLACLIQDEWVVDSTCKSINDLLRGGMVGKEAVLGWIDLQAGNVH